MASSSSTHTSSHDRRIEPLTSATSDGTYPAARSRRIVPPNGGLATNSFDERAATWDDDPTKRERARLAAARLRASVDLHPDTRLLEYGAGTGLLTEQLRPHVGHTTLAEPSSGMRDVLNAKVADGRLAGADILDLDLSRDAPPASRHDLIVALMVLHHIPDLTPVLAGFATLLTDGGTLCVIDLEEEDGSFHDPGFDGHDGFARDWLTERLAVAGFDPPRFEPCGQVNKHGRDYELFLATCSLAEAPR